MRRQRKRLIPKNPVSLWNSSCSESNPWAPLPPLPLLISSSAAISVSQSRPCSGHIVFKRIRFRIVKVEKTSKGSKTGATKDSTNFWVFCREFFLERHGLLQGCLLPCSLQAQAKTKQLLPLQSFWLLRPLLLFQGTKTSRDHCCYPLRQIGASIYQRNFQ